MSRSSDEAELDTHAALAICGVRVAAVNEPVRGNNGSPVRIRMQERRRTEGSGYFPDVEPVFGEKALLVCFAVAQSAPGKAGIGAWEVIQRNHLQRSNHPAVLQRNPKIHRESETMKLGIEMERKRLLPIQAGRCLVTPRRDVLEVKLP